MAIPRWKHGPAEDIPVESYQTAISKASDVDVMPKGTVVSKSPTATKRKPKPFSPLEYLSPAWLLYERSLSPAGAIKTLFFTEEEEQAQRLTDFAGTIGAVDLEGELTEMGETIEDIGKAAEDVGLTWDGSFKVDIPDIKFPDILGGIGDFFKGLKTPLIVGAALVGGYLLLKKTK